MPSGCCGASGAPGLCSRGMAEEAVSLTCSAMRRCSVTFSVKGFPLRNGERARCWTGLMESWAGGGAQGAAVGSGRSAGPAALSAHSWSGLASLTGDRLERKDLPCSEARMAFFLAAFFSSRCSLRLSFPGFGRVGGGERGWWLEADWVEADTVISIVISCKRRPSLELVWA